MPGGRPRSHPDPNHYRNNRENTYYCIWMNMKHRCNNPTDKDYARYGGRGIKVCERWLDFDVFVDDILASIGPKPEGMTFDRIDSNSDYEPGRVRWASHAQQSRNRDTMMPPRSWSVTCTH